MVNPEDLKDDDNYEELLEDVAEECNNHGTVKSIVIPRGVEDASLGRIFVSFVEKESAQKAYGAVAGRKFNGKVVRAHYYPEELFTKKVNMSDLKSINFFFC